MQKTCGARRRRPGDVASCQELKRPQGCKLATFQNELALSQREKKQTTSSPPPSVSSGAGGGAKKTADVHFSSPALLPAVASDPPHWDGLEGAFTDDPLFTCLSLFSLGMSECPNVGMPPRTCLHQTSTGGFTGSQSLEQHLPRDRQRWISVDQNNSKDGPGLHTVALFSALGALRIKNQ